MRILTILILLSLQCFAPNFVMQTTPSGACNQLRENIEQQTQHTFSGQINDLCNFDVTVVDETAQPPNSIGPLSGSLDPYCSVDSNSRCESFGATRMYRGQADLRANCRPPFYGPANECSASCDANAEPRDGRPAAIINPGNCATTTTTTMGSTTTTMGSTTTTMGSTTTTMGSTTTTMGSTTTTTTSTTLTSSTTTSTTTTTVPGPNCAGRPAINGRISPTPGGFPGAGGTGACRDQCISILGSDSVYGIVWTVATFASGGFDSCSCVTSSSFTITTAPAGTYYIDCRP